MADSAPSPASTSSWFVKAKRAATDQDDETWRRGGVCPTLNDFDNGHESRATVLAVMGDVSHALTAEGYGASEDGTGRGTPIVAFSHTQGLDPQPDEAAWPTLRSQGGGHGDSIPAPLGDTIVRRLTPRECERLMGWPDDHTGQRLGPDGEPAEQADGPRYKQCGNGMAAPVVAWIARRILEVDA